MTIGSELQMAREGRGLTLRDISTRTKIRVPMLQAIENDAFGDLPSGTQMKGFLKVYAREVGLDPDAIGLRYTELLAAASADAAREPAGEGHDVSAMPASADRSRVLLVALASAIVILALAGGYRAWQGPSVTAGPDVAPVPAAPVAAAVEAPRAPAILEPAAPSPASAVPPEADGPLTVEVTATGRCWIEATADGEPVASRVLEAGDRVSLAVGREAVLRLGLPTNVTVSINGRPVKPFGRPGVPATLRISPEHYRELLAP